MAVYKSKNPAKDGRQYFFRIKYRDIFREILLQSLKQKKKNSYCDLTPSKKRIRIHDFRHSCASLLINKGASIALVSKYLGHADVSITLKTYTHMFKSELTKMTDILNKL